MKTQSAGLEELESQKLCQEVLDLINIVAQLRDSKHGCPWDIEQSHLSLIPYAIEEAYEVADAVRNGNSNDLKEELGDLLLQVILHCQIAREQKEFSLKEVIEEVNKKLIRRHPHVFKKRESLNIETVQENWEVIKSSEKPKIKSSHPISDRLRLKIRSQSAFSGALKVSKETAKVGFEWNTFSEVWEKFVEEVEELKDAINQKNKLHTANELGDVLFTLTNIARWKKLDPEECLARTNQKFLDRFSIIERSVNGKISENSLHELQQLWEVAKEELDEKVDGNDTIV